LGVGGKFTAGLRQAFKDVREMRGVDRIGLAVAAGKVKHCLRNRVLIVRREAAYGFIKRIQRPNYLDQSSA